MARPQFARTGTLTIAPYDCAPYGYYGPDWFVDGSSLEPAPGSTARTASTATSTTASILVTAIADRCLGAAMSAFNHFHGNEARDGRGHVGQADHDAGHEHALPGYRGGGGHGGGRGHH